MKPHEHKYHTKNLLTTVPIPQYMSNFNCKEKTFLKAGRNHEQKKQALNNSDMTYIWELSHRREITTFDMLMTLI